MTIQPITDEAVEARAASGLIDAAQIAATLDSNSIVEDAAIITKYHGEALKRGRLKFECSTIIKLHEKGQSGSIEALKWLSKNLMGWADKSEVVQTVEESITLQFSDAPTPRRVDAAESIEMLGDNAEA